MTVQLTVLRGPKAGDVFEFDQDEIVIGSGRGSDVILRDHDVSPTHCRLSRNGDGYQIADSGSEYGTFVNGRRLKAEPISLLGNAIIELGGFVNIEYRFVANAPGKRDTAPLLMNEHEPVLVHVEDGKIRAAYLLLEESISLGRSVGNDIVIQEIDISRQHAILTWQVDRFFVEDNQSRNGTFLNGVRLKEPQPISYKDVLKLGASVQLQLAYRTDLPKGTNVISTGELAPDHDSVSTLPYALTRRNKGTGEFPFQLAEGELNGHILVAYDRGDEDQFVRTVMANLEDSRQAVWTDHDLEPGTPFWNIAVEQAHRECWLLVVIVSPAAMRSVYIKEHYQYFYNREKPIILVEYKPVEQLPIQLSNVPLISYNDEHPGQMYQQLLYEIVNLKSHYFNG